MKTVLLILTSVTLLSQSIIAQSCLPGYTYFTTQSDIDNFPFNYPGCTSIEGSIIIEGDDISNLNGFHALNSIQGIVFIGEFYGNPMLHDLSGLENLDYIGGSLYIQENDALSSLLALSNLDSIGGSLVFYDNSSIISLEGLESLISIGDDLNISFNENLSEIESLVNLIYIGGDLRFSYNPALNTLTGIEGVSAIGGSLSITWSSFKDLSELVNLTSIGKELGLYANDSLISLAGIENIDPGSISDLNIIDNINLSECEAENICEYLANPNGIVRIRENKEGCNNPPEVARSCGFQMSCLPYGVYYFYSQADIDSFSVYYPDCHELLGEANITGDDITNLNGLTPVNYVDAILSIFDNGNLSNLSGLVNIDTVVGKLYIRGNPQLNSLTGLEGLTAIIGDLEVSANDALINMSGLDSLNYLEGDCYIGYNNKLKNMTGLGSLNTVSESLAISDNKSLEALTGLESLINISQLSIHWNDSLMNFEGLQNLTHVNGSLIIYSNRKLSDFEGLSQLSNIEGQLYIHSNNILSSMNGLDNLQQVKEDLSISFNNSLNNLTGLGNLITLGGSLNITYNNSLTDLDALSNLSLIGGDINISDNDALVSITGLENVNPDSILNITIRENPTLNECNAVSICNYLASPNGVVDIFQNAEGCDSPPQIAGQCGISLPCLPFGNYNFINQADIDNFIINYPGCYELSGDVSIFGNDITNLDGLYPIISIDGNLDIGDIYGAGNEFLISLTGLRNLHSINGYLGINNNKSLTSLSGLDLLDPTSIMYLSITNNDLLTTCEIQSVCHYLNDTSSISYIYYNGPGCNYPEEILWKCQHVEIEEYDESIFNGTTGYDLTIWPNPFNNIINIGFVLDETSDICLRVFNHTGELIDVLIKGVQHKGKHAIKWDSKGLPAGIYYLQLITSENVITGKIIKSK